MKNGVIILILLLFLAKPSQAQFTSVAPGDGTLKAAIENANDLDVLILQSGGVYTESTDATINVSNNITIAAEDQYTIRPVITNMKYKTGQDVERASIFTLIEGAQLTVKNCEFDGLKEADTTANRALGDFVYIDPSQMNILLSLIFEDCMFKDAMGHIVNGTGDGIVPAPMLLNLSFDNCFMTNSKGIKFKEVTLQTIGFYECTAWNISDCLLNFENNPLDPAANADPGVVELVYSTFDNIGDRFAKAVNASGLWIFGDCIFSNQKNTAITAFDDLSATGGDITNNNFFNVGTLGLNAGNMSDCLQVDPEYADAANGDFTLLAASPLMTASGTGGPIGDPRWRAVTTDLENDSELPQGFALYQNYPNPFNPSTTISFTLSERGFVELNIYNSVGELVEHLLSDDFTAGNYNVEWNASNLTSGIYFYQLRSGNYVECKKTILLK